MFGLMTFLSFIAMVGTLGAYEVDAISTKQFYLQGVVCLIAFIIFGLLFAVKLDSENLITRR